MGVAAAVIASAVVGAGTSIYGQKKQADAMKAQQQSQLENQPKSAMQSTQGQLSEKPEDEVEVGSERSKKGSRSKGRKGLMANKSTSTAGGSSSGASMGNQSGLQV